MSSSLYSGVSGLALGAGLYRNVSGLWGGASGLINGFGGGGPYDGASLYLNFLSMTAPTFDSRITFSRGSNATVVDSTGRVTYAPANLLLWSQEFDNAYWVKNNITVASTTATSPIGTATADVIRETVTTSDHTVFGSSSGLSLNAGSYQFTLRVKPDGRDVITLAVSNGTVNNYSSVTFSLIGAGSVTQTNSAGTYTTARSGSISVDAQGFYLCTLSVTIISAPSSFISISTSDTTTFTPDSYGRKSFTGDTTKGVVIWGAQLEPVTYQTTPGAYVATTSAAYYGPRFDYDPVTLAPRGLLIEEARTNLLTYSQQFDNAAWSKLNATITADAIMSPDGTTNADLFTSTGGETRCGRNPGVLGASTTYTASIFGKLGNANGRYLWLRDFYAGFDAGFDLQTGTVSQVSAGMTASVVVYANGWFRCLVTWTTPAAPVVANQQFWVQSPSGTTPSSGTAGGQSYIWGAQLEAGAFATSYIPTVASTATRSADVATMTGTNFSSWYNQSEGTFVVDASMLALSTASTQELLALDDGTIANAIFLRANNTAGATSAVANTGGVSQGFLDIGGTSAGAPQKVAYGIKLNDAALVRNGGTVATDATYAVPTSQSRMAIGARLSGAAQLNGHLRELVYFNTRQSDTRLQTLTAPPLITTLSLDFTSGTYLVGY